METRKSPTLYVDFERHAAILAEEGFTPDQIETSLRALWSFACAMVDFGFGIHPVQQACGKDAQSLPAATSQPEDEVYLSLSHFIKSDLANQTELEQEEA